MIVDDAIRSQVTPIKLGIERQSSTAGPGHIFAQAMQALADNISATINGTATTADEGLIKSIIGKG